MSIEQPNTFEKIFDLSKDEFKRLNMQDIELMKEKGISFDMGDIIIEIDGKKRMMGTEKKDFGIILTAENIEELYGKQKLKTLGKQPKWGEKDALID